MPRACKPLRIYTFKVLQYQHYSLEIVRTVLEVKEYERYVQVVPDCDVEIRVGSKKRTL